MKEINGNNLSQEDLSKILQGLMQSEIVAPFGQNELMQQHGMPNVINHFMAMASSGVIKKEKINDFTCDPFETDTEWGMRFVWKK